MIFTIRVLATLACRKNSVELIGKRLVFLSLYVERSPKLLQFLTLCSRMHQALYVYIGL